MKKHSQQVEARAKAGDISVYCAYDKLIKPENLTGNPRNPNKHSEEQIKLLAHIIKNQGWRAPITVSNQSGYIVRGHGRLAAALQFGAELVPVDYQNYNSEAEEWADLIADNRLSELAEIDTEMLSKLISDINISDISLILTGYNDSEIENLLSSIATEDDDVVLEKNELKPYKKVHYLLSFDINLHDIVLPKIEEIRSIVGVEIESTLN